MKIIRYKLFLRVMITLEKKKRYKQKEGTKRLPLNNKVCVSMIYKSNL